MFGPCSTGRAACSWHFGEVQTHFCKENEQCKKGEDRDHSDSYCEDELSVSPHYFVIIAEQVNHVFRCVWVFDCIMTGQGGKSICRADWC